MEVLLPLADPLLAQGAPDWVGEVLRAVAAHLLATRRDEPEQVNVRLVFKNGATSPRVVVTWAEWRDELPSRR